MKTLSALAISFLLICTSLLAQSKYEDGINNLKEIKSVSEDLAALIKITWAHNTPEYAEAERLYGNTQNSVNNMIADFDARIRSGDKISRADLSQYVQKVAENCEALYSLFNENTTQGGTRSAFGSQEIVVFEEDIYNKVSSLFDSWKAYRTKPRLKKMHAVFDPCRLRDWEDIF